MCVFRSAICRTIGITLGSLTLLFLGPGLLVMMVAVAFGPHPDRLWQAFYPLMFFALSWVLFYSISFFAFNKNKSRDANGKYHGTASPGWRTIAQVTGVLIGLLVSAVVITACWSLPRLIGLGR